MAMSTDDHRTLDGPVLDQPDSVVQVQPAAAETPIPRVSGRPADLLPGHRLVTINGGDLWMECEAFVYEMYVKIGYTEPSPRHQVEELARWSDRSRFHAVLDEHDTVIGTIRTIFGNYAELPVSQFVRTDQADPDPVCEFSSLVVDPTQRSTGVIEHLYRAGWIDAARARSHAIVALIDDWLYDAFVDVYRLPFRKIGVGQHYMGTDPVPVAMSLGGDDYLDLARTNPHFYAWNLEGCEAAEPASWGMPLVLIDSPAQTNRGASASSKTSQH